MNPLTINQTHTVVVQRFEHPRQADGCQQHEEKRNGLPVKITFVRGMRTVDWRDPRTVVEEVDIDQYSCPHPSTSNGSVPAEDRYLFGW